MQYNTIQGIISCITNKYYW